MFSRSTLGNVNDTGITKYSEIPYIAREKKYFQTWMLFRIITYSHTTQWITKILQVLKHLLNRFWNLVEFFLVKLAGVPKSNQIHILLLFEFRILKCFNLKMLQKKTGRFLKDSGLVLASLSAELFMMSGSHKILPKAFKT